ncbi:MAG: tetratricopeptide repeat protein [Myxococcales bacterium]|nr:tetratricopeptide repeat protein [Myxococcales bacterium]
MSLRSRLPAILVALGLVVATLLAFEPVRENGFVSFDDWIYVEGNDEIREGWTLEGFVWAWTAVRGSLWHPLTWFSHMLDVEFFGLDPVGHHATGLILHILNVLLLFLVLGRMTGSLWPSAFVAAVFALHPLRVESVAWAAERKDVLSGFFWMLTLAAYAGYVRRPGIPRYLGLAAAFLLGLLAKPIVVTLPFVLLLLDYWPLERSQGVAGRSAIRRAWPLIREKLPLFLIAGVFAVVTLAVQPDVTLVDWEVLPLEARLPNSLTAYALYIRDLVFPNNLAVLYPFPTSPPPLWQPGLALVLVAGVSVAIATVGRSRRYLAVGWLWYLGTLLPVIGLVQVGFQTRADRYTYLPSIGLLIMVAWGAADLQRRFALRKLWFGAGAALVLAALVFATRVQLTHWRDSVTLYERALAVTSGNYPVHSNLGSVLVSQGRNAEARGHYQRALEIKPDYVYALYNLGVWLQRDGDVEAALEHYRAALRSDPDHVRSRYNLAVVQAQRGELEAASRNYTRVLEIDADHVSAHHNLGNLLRAEGRLEAAITHYRRVVELEPGHPRVHYGWGHALQLRGELDAARDHYRKVRRVAPGYAEALYERGLAFARSGRLEPAIADLREAAELRPDWPAPLRALARLRAGRPDPKLEDAERAR